ncbi:MAG: Mur ligase family protein [Bacteroidia bacterium]|nr:Mur ligase family protein [Bacteroidia bacterium]MDW8157715.1 Mur ligase family protein [Bacteroidia bacterium]
MKKIHFIAIGGSVMHSLALELKAQGWKVTGSDDEIREPARQKLAEAGLLPSYEGWNPQIITPDLDAVILGMHARSDNPELLAAQKLGLPIYSFPEFIRHQSQNKQRIVIAGSHGKTTITAMIMHVLRSLKYDFSYLVGAPVKGFEKNVHLGKDDPILLVEGDEYLASVLDPRPKFLLYQPHLVVITGIAWDHVNVFPTVQSYNEQFVQLVKSLPKAGVCIYNREDKTVKEIVLKNYNKETQYLYPYSTPPYRVRNQRAIIKLEHIKFPLKIFGKHNASNVAAAWQVCKLLGVEIQEFAKVIAQFEGAGMRLQKVFESENLIIIRDFAHAPSKVKASVDAVLQFYKNFNVIACLELHTFSSLNKSFINQYRNALKKVKNKIVLVNPNVLLLKKLPSLTRQDIQKAFNDKNLLFTQTGRELKEFIQKMIKGKSVVLLMSSGDLDGLDPTTLSS